MPFTNPKSFIRQLCYLKKFSATTESWEIKNVNRSPRQALGKQNLSTSQQLHYTWAKTSGLLKNQRNRSHLLT